MGRGPWAVGRSFGGSPGQVLHELLLGGRQAALAGAHAPDLAAAPDDAVAGVSGVEVEARVSGDLILPAGEIEGHRHAAAIEVVELDGDEFARDLLDLVNNGERRERMRASAPGCRAIQANAKVDRRGDGGRVAGDLMMLLESPQNIRMDIVSFGTTIATLTSDSKRFALMDMREKRFYVGSARPCNLARFTRVPIAGTALVELLRGQAPVLRDWQRSTGQEAPAWNNAGRYVVVLKDAHGNEEEIQLAPHPADLGKPWSAQRVRVHEVTVRQKGLVWYRAELSDHEPAPMGKESVDPDGIEAPVSPSGPMCTADIPRRIQVEVPWLGENVRFRFDDVTWNPPLSEGVFRQSQPGGTQLVPAECE